MFPSGLLGNIPLVQSLYGATSDMQRNKIIFKLDNLYFILRKLHRTANQIIKQSGFFIAFINYLS